MDPAPQRRTSSNGHAATAPPDRLTQDQERERALVGVMIRHGRATTLTEALGRIPDGAIADPWCGFVVSVLRRMVGEGRHVDQTTIGPYAEDHGLTATAPRFPQGLPLWLYEVSAAGEAMHTDDVHRAADDVITAARFRTIDQASRTITALIAAHGIHDPDVDEAISRQLATITTAHQAAPATTTAPRFLTRDQLADLPKPVPVIERTLDGGTVFVVAGYFGTLKSFIALDWLSCLATERPWNGRAVQGGARRGLYVVGEGAYGIHPRLDAWERWNGATIPDDMLLTWPGAVDLLNTRSVAEICAVVRGEGIQAAVFDTLAKCIPGADENSAQDMGRAVDSLYQILAAMQPGGIVGAVHHTGKDKTTIRGSSALENGVDTVYLAEGDAAAITLRRTKRKDGATPDQHAFAFEPVPGTASGVASSSHGGHEKLPSVALVLSHFVSLFGATSASSAMIINALPELSPATVYRALKLLADNGTLLNIGTTKRPIWQLSPDYNQG